jgi:hypothetical protein
MSKGNNNPQELINRIEEARSALDQALTLLQADSKLSKQTKTPKISRATPPKANALDFTMPIRPFVKKYSIGMTGAQKFTLLLAFLTKGDTTKTISLADIEAQWNKMTSKGLLGMNFNRFHTAQARDNDWVVTEKAGTYHLRPSWKVIFNG